MTHAPSAASKTARAAEQSGEWADVAPPLSWSKYSMSRPASFRRHLSSDVSPGERPVGGMRTRSADKAERPLCVQLRDLRRDARQRARRADTDRSRPRNRTDEPSLGGHSP